MRFAGIVEPGVSTGVVTSSQYIKGGYAVFQTQAEYELYIATYGNMDDSVIVKGMPLYVVETEKLFRVKTEPSSAAPCEIEEEETTIEIVQQLNTVVDDVTQLQSDVSGLQTAVNTVETQVQTVETHVEALETKVETLETHAILDTDVLEIYGGSATDLI